MMPHIMVKGMEDNLNSFIIDNKAIYSLEEFFRDM